MTLQENNETQSEKIHYLVFVVWRDNGSRKWYPSVMGDNPSWSVIEVEKKRFCLGLCAVNLNKKKEVTWKENVEDGKKIRRYFKMIKVNDVKSHECKVKF